MTVTAFLAIKNFSLAAPAAFLLIKRAACFEVCRNFGARRHALFEQIRFSAADGPGSMRPRVGMHGWMGAESAHRHQNQYYIYEPPMGHAAVTAANARRGEMSKGLSQKMPSIER